MVCIWPMSYGKTNIIFYTNNGMSSRKHRDKIQNKCKKYKTCKHVPCGQSMLNCEPSYCSNGSKNWGICNVMSKKDVRYRKTCKNQNKCKLVKNDKIGTKTGGRNKHKLYEIIITNDINVYIKHYIVYAVRPCPFD